MKALIYDPYLDILGGGERYVLTFALALIKKNYEVTIAWPDKTILSSATNRFGLDFSKIDISPELYKKCSLKVNLWERFLFTKNFDLIFWISDGSLPFLFSKNNLIHLQVPFIDASSKDLASGLKSLFINKFVYNSEFTKKVYEKKLDPQKGVVLYPPIDVESLESKKKEKVVLSVGRFSSKMTEKNQNLIIETFRNFSQKEKGYKLILAGGLVGDNSVIASLKKLAQGLNVEIIPNPNFSDLKNLYSKSRFFWHAAGFGIDESKYPEKVEHFGMTTVEAMASGCIPIVINKGGQREIVVPGTGFLCENDNEIVKQTMYLIANPKEADIISSQAINQSKQFSVSEFYQKVDALLS